MTEHQPTLVAQPEPSAQDDLNELPRLLQRIDNTGGRGALRARDVQLLARTVRRYAPLTQAVKPELPSVLSAPSCIVCGFAVEKRGDTCEACKQKEGQYAKPVFELAPQPTPAYQREQETSSEG